MIWRDQRFYRRDLPIDFIAWYDCEFVECELRYFGHAKPTFVGCTFTNCDWRFAEEIETWDTMIHIERISAEAGESIRECIARGGVRAAVEGPAKGRDD